METPKPQQPRQLRTWDLGDGSVVQLSFPYPLTRQHVARLRRYIEALAVEAAIAWGDADGADKAQESK